MDYAFRPPQEDKSPFKVILTDSSFYFAQILGPPPIPVIITLLPERGQQGVVTLRCEAHRLDAHLIYSYQWQWKFQDRPINEDEKYKIFQSNSSHNSCRQTKSFAVLQISKISKHDIGQYKCWLQKSGIMLAGKDVFLSGFGKLS